MPFSVYARGDSSTANNASLNVESTNQQPTVLLTFAAASGGDEKLEFNDGQPDPDTVVYLGSDLTTAYTFTLEFGGYLPQSNKLSNVAGVDLRGAEILVLTLSNGDRYFFVKDSSGTTSWQTIMDAFPNGAHAIENTYACYAAGTLIETPGGPVAVEALRVGDLVLTDAGLPVPVRFTAARRFTARELQAFPPLRPVLIPAGGLAPGVPSRDLVVSGLHRILVRGAELERLFGLDAAFVAARDLPQGRPAPAGPLTYVHFLCDAHACVIANGCESESLFPGDMALAGLSARERDTVADILGPAHGTTAYPCLTAREAAVWRDALQRREKRTA